MTGAPFARHRRLLVWRTVAASYAAVFRNLGQLVRISWLWLLIMMPIYALAHWLVWLWTQLAAATGIAANAIGLLPSVIEIPFLASIAVAWHRLLLKDEWITDSVYLRRDAVVGTYALYSLVLFALTSVLFALTSAPFLFIDFGDSSEDEIATAAFVSLGLIILSLVSGLLLLPRLSLVLPAVALGEPASFGEAWWISRQNTWRLAVATLACLLPPFVGAIPVYIYLVEDANREAFVLFSVMTSLVYAVLVIVSVTLLSLAYRHFRDQPSGESG